MVAMAAVLYLKYSLAAMSLLRCIVMNSVQFINDSAMLLLILNVKQNIMFIYNLSIAYFIGISIIF